MVATSILNIVAQLDCNSAGCVFSRDNGHLGKHTCTSNCISCGAYDTGAPSKSPSGPVDVSRTPPKSR